MSDDSNPSLKDLNNSEQETISPQFQSSVNDKFENLTDTNENQIINQTSIPTDQVITSVSDNTSESAGSFDMQNISTSARPTTNQQNNQSSTKMNRKSHKQTDQDQSLNDDDDNQDLRQRSSSSSSSSSTSSSTDNKASDIPYETLHNEDDDDDIKTHHNLQ